MKILIVEDNLINRELMKLIMAKYGSCDVAVDGVQAVEKFKYAIDIGEPYDLICLDIVLPGIDGQEVLNRVRQYEVEMKRDGLNGVKVIMTTAMSDSLNVKKAFVEQCDGYLLKPIDEKKIEDMINKLSQ